MWERRELPAIGLQPTDGNDTVVSDLPANRKCAMDLDKEILARIKAAKAWDKDSVISDFQLKPAKNGSVLINLKTRRAQLLYDDDSELHDLEALFGYKKREK